jgi:hypothetical protein
MHLYTIKMKDGTEHKDVLLTNERGQVANLSTDLLRDVPCVHILEFVGCKSDIRELKLFEIQSAICENERVAPGKLMDVDELPFWIDFHNAYLANRGEIDSLPEAERANATYMRIKRA